MERTIQHLRKLSTNVPFCCCYAINLPARRIQHKKISLRLSTVEYFVYILRVGFYFISIYLYMRIETSTTHIFSMRNEWAVVDIYHFFFSILFKGCLLCTTTCSRSITNSPAIFMWKTFVRVIMRILLSTERRI